jgi:hypothetical protein
MLTFNDFHIYFFAFNVFDWGGPNKHFTLIPVLNSYINCAFEVSHKKRAPGSKKRPLFIGGIPPLADAVINTGVAVGLGV